MRRTLTLGILALAYGLAPDARAQDDGAAQVFSLPEDRDARALADEALGHLRGRRFGEALAVLGRMIETHAGSILPPAYRDARATSAHPVYPGAAGWARNHLRDLGGGTLDAWRERHDAEDARTLDDARARADRRSLADLARRDPLSARSAQALLVEGDLEFERGDAAQARVAWERARARDGSLAEHLAPRLAHAEALALETPRGASPLERGSGRPGSAALGSSIPLPRRDTTPWFAPLDLTPFGAGAEFQPALFPVLSGDRVLVSSSLRLSCLDFFTGELLWQAGPPDGWSELDGSERKDLIDRISRSQVLVAPAVEGGIVVAALQLPFSTEPDENWQGIVIQVQMPQRRLFAFDLATGRALWDHAPRMSWRAKERRFEPARAPGYAQEMRVAAPPVIAGTRVLVPCYRLQGRIEFHVACYALETGELLWSTPVVSGQRGVNMFGRAIEEFTCAPVVPVGDRVVVQTDLGSLAALDLYTGEILWESLYRQIPPPEPHGSWTPPTRRTVWRVAPPVVVGDVLVAAPNDSDELSAFQISDGRVLWTYSQQALQNLDPKRALAYDLLVGADQDMVLLSGQKLGCLRKPGGIASTAPFELAWPTVPVEEDEEVQFRRKLPWPVLGADTILVGTRSERRVLDRQSGTERHFLSAPNDARSFGNLLVADGALFSLGRDGLAGFLDWNELLERPRARLALHPDDDEAVLDFARLYVRRSEVESALGEPGGGQARLEAARTSLEGVRARKLAEVPRDERYLERLDSELFRILTREAALFEAAENRAAALASLAEARTLAPSRESLRDCLLAEERVLADARRAEEALAVLDELEQEAADLPLPLPSGRWTALGLPALDPDTTAPIPLDLWALFERAGAEAGLGRSGPALAAWHEVLARYDAFPLGSSSAGAEARARITTALARPEGRAAYTEFEARAAELYGRALEAGDDELLATVGRLFPHSQAASDADRARLEAAYGRQDAAAMADLLYAARGPVERRPELERASLLELADLLERAGNADFERGLIERLVRETPEARSTLAAHAGRPLVEVLEEVRLRTKEDAPPPPRFDERIVPVEDRPGLFAFLGRFLRSGDTESAPEELHVYLVTDPDGQAIEAFSSAGARPAWRHPLTTTVFDRRACAVARDRIVIGDRSGLTALDAQGTVVWRRATEGPVQTALVQSGILLAGVGDGDPSRVVACDVRNGIALWSLVLPEGGRWRPPIVGGAHAAFFSVVFPGPPRVAVVDLFRGRVVADYALEAAGERIDPNAWISEDRLLVPRFVSPQGLTAYELRSGREIRRLELPEGELFHSIVELGGKDYWITQSESASSSGAIYAFEPASGTLRRVATLAVGEEPIGIPAHARTRVDGDSLYTLTRGATSELPIRVFELPYRVRKYALKIAPEDLFLDGDLPFPAASETCIALVIVTRDRTGRSGEPIVAFLERKKGEENSRYPVDLGSLAPEFGAAKRIELRGLGESLFALGLGSNSRGLHLQILDKMR